MASSPIRPAVSATIADNSASSSSSSSDDEEDADEDDDDEEAEDDDEDDELDDDDDDNDGEEDDERVFVLVLCNSKSLATNFRSLLAGLRFGAILFTAFTGLVFVVTTGLFLPTSRLLLLESLFSSLCESSNSESESILRLTLDVLLASRFCLRACLAVSLDADAVVVVVADVDVVAVAVAGVVVGAAIVVGTPEEPTEKWFALDLALTLSYIDKYIGSSSNIEWLRRSGDLVA